MDFKEVGELIRKVRKDRGMTLDDLADENISRTTLSSLERGHTQNPQKVRYILRKLDLNLSDLSEKRKEEAEEQGLELMILENRVSVEPREVLNQLSKPPSGYKRHLVNFIKGKCYFETKQYDRATDFFNKVLRELEKNIDEQKTNLKPICLNLLSIIEFSKGNKERALSYVKEALNCFDINGERQHYYINLLTNKAIYLRGLGRAEEAIKTLEQIPLNSPDIQIEAVIGIYDLQAKLKRDINLYDEAVYYAKKGLNLATINFNYERQLELYITLGETYRKAGKLHWAEKCLKAAIMLKDKISWRQFLVLDAYIKLGIVYFEKYDFQLSGKILQKALKIAKKQDDVAKYSQGLLYLAKILLLQSKYEEARAAFTEVYKLHSDQKNDLQALCGLSQVCLSQRDDVNYNKYSKLYFESLKNQKEVISDDGISDSISSFRR